jgi:hypothetical protein
VLTSCAKEFSIFERWRRRWWRRRWSSVLYFALVLGALIIPFVSLPEQWKYLNILFGIVTRVGGNLLANVIGNWCGPLLCFDSSLHVDWFFLFEVSMIMVYDTPPRYMGSHEYITEAA